jgi:hypothetical protein
MEPQASAKALSVSVRGTQSFNAALPSEAGGLRDIFYA